MNTLPALSVANVAVRQHDGLYSLNDLHKASGGATKHQPYEFVRLDQTQALIAELSKSGDSRNYIQTKRGKHNGGTFACRELVIAYAAWISPAFHLQVIRVFLDSVAAQRRIDESRPYAVLPGQTLSAEQADELRRLLTEAAQKLPHAQQGAFLQRGWSKLKAHFGVPYREIPASQYSEAVSLITRHAADAGEQHARLTQGQVSELLKGANTIIQLRKEADRIRDMAYCAGSDFICGLASALNSSGAPQTAARLREINGRQMDEYNATVRALMPAKGDFS